MINEMLAKAQFRRPQFIKDHDRSTPGAMGLINEEAKRVYGGPTIGPAFGGVDARIEAQETLLSNGQLVETEGGKIIAASEISES